MTALLILKDIIKLYNQHSLYIDDEGLYLTYNILKTTPHMLWYKTAPDFE
jgi:hypothetical protein